MRNFASTLRKRERGMSLSSATTLISYGRGFVDHQATRTIRGGVIVGFGVRFRPGLIRSAEHSERLGRDFGTSMGFSGHQ